MSSTSSSTSSPTSTPSLLTTFVPSPSCLTDHWQFNDTHTYTQSSSTLTFQYVALGPASTSDCLPDGFKPQSQFYSPGVCPSGYSQACSAVVSIGSLTETRATCCPKGYTCETANDWWWQSTEACAVSMTATRTFTITSKSAKATTSWETAIEGGINAYGISIRYQAQDFATPTSTSMSSTSTSQTSPTTSPTPTTAPSSSSGLSGGAIAGIIIGILAVVALLAGLWFFWYRPKRRHVYEPSPQVGDEPPKDQYPLSPREVDGGIPHHELPVDENSRHELSVPGGNLHELPGDNAERL